MSYLQGTLYVEGERRNKVFTRTMPNMRGEVTGHRLEVTVPSFYCRDEIIRSLSFLFQDVYEAGYKLRGYSKNQYSPKFTLLAVKTSVTSTPYANEFDYKSELGSFSPLASPYLLRYIIGKYRNANIKYVWFEKWLKVADDKGIRLQEDFAKAWQLDKMTNSFYGEYARMGLTHLRTLAPAGVLSQGTAIDYLEAFPPSEFK